MNYPTFRWPRVSTAEDCDYSDPLSEGGAILPSQFFDGHRKKAEEPIRRLMLAVLADALRCYQKGPGTRSAARKRAFVETEQWLFSRAANTPFSFENVCSTLDIAPEYFRRMLRRWQADRISGGRLIDTRRSSPFAAKHMTATHAAPPRHLITSDNSSRTASQL